MTTLNQVERLVRKITELLGQPAQEEQAAKLAQEFAQLGRATARRLEQCALMIEAGEESQALQLAETPPPLLDLITLLSFRQAGEWRTYCQTHNLPAAEPFYDKHVRVLNTTYGKGASQDHPLYRDYRRAMMQNDEEGALAILRVIARVNPADPNSAQEIKRLEEKVVRARIESLRLAQESGDPEAVLALVAKYERAGLVIPPDHPVWQAAQLLRCQRLLDQAEARRDDGNWQEAEPIVEEIKSVAAQHEVLFPEPDVARFDALEEWTMRERGDYVRNQDRSRALDALDFQIKTGETLRASRATPPAAQLEAELASLTTKWQDAGRFEEPLDESFAQRYQEMTRWLQGCIRRDQQRRQTRKVMAWVGVLAVLGVVGWAAWEHFRARQVAADLARLEQSREVGGARRVLEQTPARVQGKTGVAEAVARGNEFVTRELELKSRFDQQLADLRSLAAAGKFEKVPAQRSECAQALESVAPEFKAAGRKELEAFDQQWQQKVASAAPAGNEDFSKRLQQLQQLASERMNPASGVDSVSKALPEAQALANELATRAHGPVPIEAGLARQFQEATNNLAGLAAKVAQWTSAREKMEHAQSLGNYVDALATVETSPFASAPERTCAAEVRALNPSEASLLGGLLLPGHPAAWGAFTNPAGPPLVWRPVEPTDAEKSAYAKLRNDRNIREVYLYNLTSNPRNQQNTGNTKLILTQGKLADNRTGKKGGMIYDPKKSPSFLRFEQGVVESWEWDYEKLEPMGLTRESDAFQRLELGDLIDLNTGKYQKSIIDLIDRANGDGDASAVFRTYVILRLVELAELRPMEWGLIWSPSATREVERLKELGGVHLQSGDWMVPNQLALYEGPLRAGLAEAKKVPLAHEAEFYHRLAVEVCTARFVLVGHANADGKPVLTLPDAAKTATECWGWSARTHAPALLFRRAPGESSGWQQVEAPLCYTPLFVFQGDRRRIWEQTKKTTGHVVQPGTPLPPLFGDLP